VTGRVISWNSARRFGFIRPDEGARDCFVHVAGLVEVTELRRGQTVSFTLVEAGRGPRAVDVRPLDEAVR
jgi:cold shock protein